MWLNLTPDNPVRIRFIKNGLVTKLSEYLNRATSSTSEYNYTLTVDQCLFDQNET